MNYLLKIALAISTLAAPGCFRSEPPPSYLATPLQSPLSPSGAYSLNVVQGRDNADYWSFEIRRTATEKVEFACGDRFYIRHTTYILWGEDDRVWVYSGDIGTYVWSKQNGVWEKSIYIYGAPHPAIPNGLKTLKPKIFGQAKLTGSGQ